MICFSFLKSEDTVFETDHNESREQVFLNEKSRFE